MSKNTENFNLIKPELSDPADITQMNQNWDTLDNALIQNKVFGAIGTHSQFTGSTYTVTIPGLTELYVGLKLTIIPDTDSVIKYCYLNVNELGKKYIIQPSSKDTASAAYGSTDNWIRGNYPIEVLYDGTYWRVLNNSASEAEYLLGVVSMKNGGTGSEDGAIGLMNLFAAGSTVLSSHQYGETLPTAGVPGRVFFKKVT